MINCIKLDGWTSPFNDQEPHLKFMQNFSIFKAKFKPWIEFLHIKLVKKEEVKGETVVKIEKEYLSIDITKINEQS